MTKLTKEQLIEDLKASTQNASGMFEISEDTICALMSMLSATPAPVSVPDEVMAAMQKVARIRLDLNDFDGDKRGILDCLGDAEEELIEVVNLRSAMFHGSEPETTAYKLPFEQWISQQTGAIDVDCGCVMTEVFFHWLRVAYEAGNSQVIPDDVRRMDWLVSKTVDVREPMFYGSHSLFWSQTITDEEDDYHATKLREQIDAAMAAENAAAPQQELR